MNPKLEKLKPYPFERLRILLADAKPDSNQELIRWSIGEPSGAPPPFVLDVLRGSLASLGNYPTTQGTRELREAIAAWLCNRFKIKQELIDPDRHVIPVSGTREALFSIAQAVVEPDKSPYVVSPNPFYQIYEGACLLSGGQLHFMNLKEENSFNPDFSEVPESIWKQCSLVYVCSPSNPTGACLTYNEWKKLIDLSQKYGLVIAADECYSEIYRDESSPPVGLLQAAVQAGLNDFKNCLVFHSLSKRSNLPGLRSGFVAGDAEILSKYLLYRTYHGCTMAEPVQKASAAAWRDEEHVIANRLSYRKNFEAVIKTVDADGSLGLKQPEGAFYFWFKTPVAEERFCFELFEKEHLHVLPGSYLSRETNGINPGANRVRMALVASTENCLEGAVRLKRYLDSISG